MKRVGILTSGGDCGGLNAIIKGAALAAISHGIHPYLITNGYIGLVNLYQQKKLLELTPQRLDQFTVANSGSEAGNSRLKISKIEDPEKYQKIHAGLKRFQIDCLLIAGGDDTGSVVVDLSSQKIPCIHLPKTMDLDLQPYSVGGDSAINRIASMARDAVTTARTHNRIMIMEVFGRYAGHTALYGGLAADADIILLPEIAVDLSVVYEYAWQRFQWRFECSDHQCAHVLIIIAEGMRDQSGAEIVDKSQPKDSFGHFKLIGAGKYVANYIKEHLKKDQRINHFLKKHNQYVEQLYTAPEVREINPGHLVRCGRGYAYDACFGLEAGLAAIELAKQKKFGVTVCGFSNGEISVLDCQQAIQQRHVSLANISTYERLGICFGRKPKYLSKIKINTHSKQFLRRTY